MITVRYITHEVLEICDGDGVVMATIFGRHTLKEGEILPYKSITLDDDVFKVEVERPLSLVDAVGAYHGFSLNYSTNGDGKQKRKLYAAWKHEIEKEKT